MKHVPRKMSKRKISPNLDSENLQSKEPKPNPVNFVENSSVEMQELEDKRKEHQKKLEEKKRKVDEISLKIQEAEDRFNKKKVQGSKDEGTVTVHQCYSDPSQFPKELTRNKIFVDPSRETVILPIFGLMVPFHISYIKNASKTDEEYLRINFVTPEVDSREFSVKFQGKGAAAVQKNETFKQPQAIRIKEISYR